jgi:tRNA(fMet)-specific endonuclease VapC
VKIAIDTNAYRAFIDGDQNFVSVVQHATKIGLSVVVLGELRAGFQNGSRKSENERVLNKILATQRVEVLDISESTASTDAQVWFALRKKGLPIPTNDIWIAAQCLEAGFTLLTRDSHFSNISGLELLP